MALGTEVKAQYALVFDLNKCIGCHTCTIACKNLWTKRPGSEYMYWNNVESKPGRGYPKNWEKKEGGFDSEGLVQLGKKQTREDHGPTYEFNFKDVLMEGKEDYVRADQPRIWSYDWDDEAGEGEFPNSYYFWLPRICNHCSNPACLQACPRGAIYKREEDGIVLVDQERCRGYQYCVRACPYGKVFFNPVAQKAEKCVLCYPRVEKGIPPGCVSSCVGRIRFIGLLEDETSPVYKLVKEWKVALPLHPEYGTEPNVYYVPPLSSTTFDKEMRMTGKPRIPIEYLGSLFGGVEPVRRALETLSTEMRKVREGESSELMTLLIGYTARDRFWGFEQTGSGKPLADA